jgi:hypothetical protein
LHIEAEYTNIGNDTDKVEWKWDVTEGTSLAHIEEMVAMCILVHSDQTGINEMEIMREILKYMQDFRGAPENERPFLATGERLKGFPKPNPLIEKLLAVAKMTRPKGSDGGGFDA